MSPHVARFVERLHDAEEDLRREVEQQQRRWQYRVRRGRVWFDRELREAHRRLRQGIPAYVREGGVLTLLTAPVVYSLLFPLLILDLWVAAAALTLATLVLTIQAWRRGWWRLSGRISLTLVLLGGLGCVLLLNHWNLLGWKY